MRPSSSTSGATSSVRSAISARVSVRSEALDQFEHREDVAVRHRAFELDPYAKLAYDATARRGSSPQKYSMHLVAQCPRTMHERIEGERRANVRHGVVARIRRPSRRTPSTPIGSSRSPRHCGDSRDEAMQNDVFFRAYFAERGRTRERPRTAERAGRRGWRA